MAIGLSSRQVTSARRGDGLEDGSDPAQRSCARAFTFDRRVLCSYFGCLDLAFNCSFEFSRIRSRRFKVRARHRDTCFSRGIRVCFGPRRDYREHEGLGWRIPTTRGSRGDSWISRNAPDLVCCRWRPPKSQRAGLWSCCPGRNWIACRLGPALSHELVLSRRLLDRLDFTSQ